VRRQPARHVRDEIKLRKKRSGARPRPDALSVESSSSWVGKKKTRRVRMSASCMQMSAVEPRADYACMRAWSSTYVPACSFFVPNIDIVFILLVDEVLCNDTKPVQSLVAAPVKPSLDFDFLSCLEFATCRFWIKIPNYTSIYSNKSW
jgi:hypothetical protein